MDALMRMSDKLVQNREELLGDLIRQLEKLQSRTSTNGEQVYQLTVGSQTSMRRVLRLPSFTKTAFSIAEYAQDRASLIGRSVNSGQSAAAS